VVVNNEHIEGTMQRLRLMARFHFFYSLTRLIILLFHSSQQQILNYYTVVRGEAWDVHEWIQEGRLCSAQLRDVLHLRAADVM
jgi:hypothetical protein